MMGLLFGDGAGAIDESERFGEIRESKYFVQVVLIDDFPVGQLRLERLQSIAFERRNATAARNAGFVS